MGRNAEFGTGHSGEPDLYHGQMDTERFHFDAFGKTPAEVHKALDDGFAHHLEQYGGNIREWRAETGSKRPSQHYEPHVQPIRAGRAYRDGDELGGPRPKR